MVVELTGLWLLASPRDEADWEEGPAGARAQAARQARMAAAEMESLSGVPAGVTPEKEKGGFGWSFLTNLGIILLNRLQFKLEDVHLSFRAAQDSLVICLPSIFTNNLAVARIDNVPNCAIWHS